VLQTYNGAGAYGGNQYKTPAVTCSEYDVAAFFEHLLYQCTAILILSEQRTFLKYMVFAVEMVFVSTQAVKEDKF